MRVVVIPRNTWNIADPMYLTSSHWWQGSMLFLQQESGSFPLDVLLCQSVWLLTPQHLNWRKQKFTVKKFTCSVWPYQIKTYNFLHVVPGFFQPFVFAIVFHSLFQVILSFHVQLDEQNRGKERGANKQEVEGKVLSWQERPKYLQTFELLPLHDRCSKLESESLQWGLEAGVLQKTRGKF